MKQKRLWVSLAIVLALILAAFFLFPQDDKAMVRYTEYIQEKRYEPLRTYHQDPVVGLFLTEDGNHTGIAMVTEDHIGEVTNLIHQSDPTFLSVKGAEETSIGILLPSTLVEDNSIHSVSIKDTESGELPIDEEQDIFFSFGFLEADVSIPIQLQFKNKDLEVVYEFEVK
ncbi:hypothetical protein JCM19047_3527 [Bacillus sp. JCM 19047]|nr:hypothetical protein JCM19047_3527 [Bacillus sp. JCM 19047]